jgi:hypothetical protein
LTSTWRRSFSIPARFEELLVFPTSGHLHSCHLALEDTSAEIIPCIAVLGHQHTPPLPVPRTIMNGEVGSVEQRILHY